MVEKVAPTTHPELEASTGKHNQNDFWEKTKHLMQLGLKQNKTGFVLVVRFETPFFFKNESTQHRSEGCCFILERPLKPKIKRAQTGDQTPETNNPKQNPCFEVCRKGACLKARVSPSETTFKKGQTKPTALSIKQHHLWWNCPYRFTWASAFKQQTKTRRVRKLQTKKKTQKPE